MQLSFLMVGHTHEDIDQVFSKVSTHMTKTPVYDMEGLYNCESLLLLNLYFMCRFEEHHCQQQS